MDSKPPEKAKIIRVSVLKNGEELVNINFPVNLIDSVKKMIPRDELKKHQIDIETALAIVKHGVPKGKIVDFKDKKGLEVTISIE